MAGTRTASLGDDTGGWIAIAGLFSLGFLPLAVQSRDAGQRRGARRQADERLAAGDDWQDTGLVFTTHHGTALDAGNVRKMFKRVCTEAGNGDSWTPRSCGPHSSA